MLEKGIEDHFPGYSIGFEKRADSLSKLSNDDQVNYKVSYSGFVYFF